MIYCKRSYKVTHPNDSKTKIKLLTSSTLWISTTEEAIKNLCLSLKESWPPILKRLQWSLKYPYIANLFDFFHEINIFKQFLNWFNFVITFFAYMNLLVMQIYVKNICELTSMCKLATFCSIPSGISMVNLLWLICLKYSIYRAMRIVFLIKVP